MISETNKLQVSIQNEFSGQCPSSNNDDNNQALYTNYYGSYLEITFFQSCVFVIELLTDVTKNIVVVQT